MRLAVRFTGKILDKLRDVRTKARKELTDGIRQASDLLLEATIREAPASTGNLRKSMRREILNEGKTALIFTDEIYGLQLHGDGRSERSRPFTIPAKECLPGGTLYRWAQKHGMNPWAVRAAIRRRGIKHNPFMKRAADANQDKVIALVGKSLGKIVTHLAD